MDGYLFDTCVISHWFAKNPAVMRRVSALTGYTYLYISTISIGEIEFGHASIKATDKAKQAEFRRWIKAIFHEETLPVTANTAMYYGMFKRELYTKFRPKGKRPETCVDVTGQELGIDENDLWLVSQACDRNLIFVTTDKMARIKEIVSGKIGIESWPC